MLNYIIFAILSLFSAQLMAESTGSETVLYYSPTCGHCQKVLSYLNEQHKTVNMKNVKEPSVQSDFRSLNVSGVPTLVVNGKTIVGDVDIINYFKEHPEVLR